MEIVIMKDLHLSVTHLFRLLRDVKRHLSCVRGILCLPLGGIKAHQTIFHVIKGAVYLG